MAKGKPIDESTLRHIDEGLRTGEKICAIAARCGVGAATVGRRMRMLFAAQEQPAVTSLAEPPGANLPLTAKQLLFVQEYLVDLNATHACIRAGYGPKCAPRTGYVNLKNPLIRRLINEELAVQIRRCQVTVATVLTEYARIAFADIRQVARWSDEGITLIPSDELDENAAHSIAQVRIAPGPGGQQQVLVKQHDKLEALNKLAAYLQLFKHTLTMQHTGPHGEALRAPQVTVNFHELATEDLETLERIAGNYALQSRSG
ncbi:MAG: terminase small subunit [Armatimonadota bacterium]